MTEELHVVDAALASVEAKIKELNAEIGVVNTLKGEQGLPLQFRDQVGDLLIRHRELSAAREMLQKRERNADLIEVLEALVGIARRSWPEKGHEGSCGPWASCDGLCQALAAHSEVIQKAEHQLRLLGATVSVAGA